jgi:hypothetical protein
MTEAGAGGKGHKGLPWIIRGEEKRSDWFRVTVAPFSDSGSRSREAPPSEWAPAQAAIHVLRSDCQQISAHPSETNA